jgi:pimeloyl-ACP methyl ester carboxylesterase
MSSASPQKFEVSIPQDVLDDLTHRLRATRFAPDFGNDHWEFGVPTAYLRELVEYWANEFDWRSIESRINDYDQYKTEVDGIPIHFCRVPGRGPSPLPLILTHGWPWTFWDYRRVLEPLTDPGAHGGDPADAFELIVPSLPGYAFSTPLSQTGVGYPRIAHLWHSLMTQSFGFERYGAGGGDWGAFVTAHLAHVNPTGLAGAYLTFPALLGYDSSTLGPDDFEADEAGGWEQNLYARGVSGSHMAVHVAAPQTLAHAMTDSPAGLAAWMVERRRSWSDCNGDVESVFTKEDLATSFSLYWLTNSFAGAIRTYPSSFRTPWVPEHDRTPPLQAPTGIAQSPKELLVVPRHIAAEHANLVHHTRLPAGGHFAPFEQADAIVEDLRKFFRPLRP